MGFSKKVQSHYVVIMSSLHMEKSGPHFVLERTWAEARIRMNIGFTDKWRVWFYMHSARMPCSLSYTSSSRNLINSLQPPVESNEINLEKFHDESFKCWYKDRGTSEVFIPTS